MENFGNILPEPEVEAAANELSKNMAENMKASIDMCVAATADVAIGELTEHSGTLLKVVENQGLAIDYKAVQSVIDGEEAVACACDTCLEEAGPDQTLDEIDVPDTNIADGLQMALEAVADLKARFEALEERIALFNVRSSHKL
ncbi:MAG TPA: hypothetical protein VMS08_02170 [Candidatus Saccharimonadia bacterium]|nr:hypothetical protein [Candidatus Saccharimonadia bacterium]